MQLILYHCLNLGVRNQLLSSLQSLSMLAVKILKDIGRLALLLRRLLQVQRLEIPPICLFLAEDRPLVYSWLEREMKLFFSEQFGSLLGADDRQ